MFFKRRSRANSYIEPDSPPRSQSQQYDRPNERYDRPESQHNSQPPVSRGLPQEQEIDMYSRQQAPQEVAFGAPHGAPHGAPRGANGLPVNITGGSLPLSPTLPSSKAEPTPDLLQRAFNEALRPYNDKIDQLETQVADLQNWVEQLELQKREVFEWIDKRGLRPDVPPAIAKIMDSSPSNSAPTLSAQLDRKITIVNFDLHRLQDDLNSPLPTSHFAAAMLKFLPDVERLCALPTGPRLAFDLLLKLGGNVNSHGGLDSGDPEDLQARKDFYTKLDAVMVEIVRGRFQEGEEWAVSREIKRIEKTAAYLRTYGVEPYFPQTLELMRREEAFSAGAQQQMANGHGGTPPRYQ